MTEPIFLRTSAGIISLYSVSFVAITKNSIAIYIQGVDNPLFLKEPEASEFLKYFRPLIDVRVREDAQTN